MLGDRQHEDPSSTLSLQLCRAEVSCRVFGKRSQQGICCEMSKSLSCGHGPVAVLLNLKVVSEALAIREKMELGMLLPP